MKIETKFSNGDLVYAVSSAFPSKIWRVNGPLTIGQVRVTITDSPGLEGENLFDNYMAQKGTEEEYMCIETGIGSGTLWSVEKLFQTKFAAEEFVNNKNSE